MGKHALANVEGFVSRGKESFNFDPRQIVVLDGFNPRDEFGDDEDLELKANIAVNGVIKALWVQKIGKKLVLRDGGRRLWACNELIEEGSDIPSVPVKLVDKTYDETDALYLALNANKGKALTVIQKAKALARLKNDGQKVKDIARRLGCSQVSVYEHIKLAAASPEILELFKKGQISIREAAKIAAGAKESRTAQLQAVKKAKDKKNRPRISVKWDRKTERYAVIGAVTPDQKTFFEDLYNSKLASSMMILGIDPQSLNVRMDINQTALT